MKTRVIMDQAGRIAIPASLREELHLEPGDSLDMEIAGEQIILRPARGTNALTQEHGVWVLHTGQPLPVHSTDEMLQRIHSERDLANLGKDE